MEKLYYIPKKVNRKPAVAKGSRRCKATTKKGKRCKAFATLHGYCMNHYTILRRKSNG